MLVFPDNHATNAYPRIKTSAIPIDLQPVVNTGRIPPRRINAGLTLRAVMPGIDIERDLLANTDARSIVPDDPAPKTVPVAVVTGKNFQIDWAEDSL